MTDAVDAGQQGELALVTGASGFIGSSLCTHLLQKGYRVRALLRQHSAAESLPDGIEIIRAVLTDQDSLHAACEDVDLVFHLGGISQVGAASLQEMQAVNVEGTRALMHACQQAGIKRFLFMSSILAAALDERELPADEHNAYALSKKQAEAILLDNASDDFEPRILRPVNVYGAGMQGNIAGLIRRIQKGGLPPLPRLANELPMIGDHDLCEAALLAANAPAAAGQIYPVTDGSSYTPTSLEHAIYEALGRKKPGWHTPRVVFFLASLAAQIFNNLGIWNNDLGLRTYRNLVDTRVASCEKITTELGFQPTRNLADELPAIIAAL